MIGPHIDDIIENRERLGDQVLTTPVHPWRTDTIRNALGKTAEVWCKLELLQHAGSFKPRGAMTVANALSDEELKRGLVAVSAGNHALAVAYVARAKGANAKVVMIETANPARVEGARALGAEVVLAPNVHEAFDLCTQIEKEEGRFFIHPFEGPLTVLGTASVGLEFCRQTPGELDAVIVPIGGGGLCAGMAAAFKQLSPRTRVYGVEPEGAPAMAKSFAAGAPQRLDSVDTIADSLAAPFTADYTFSVCREYVDEIVCISDAEMTRALALLFRELKLAVEPAGAAATAAMLGPLRARLQGKRVGIIACGANIDAASYASYLAAGAAGEGGLTARRARP